MSTADQAWRASLRSVTIADLVRTVAHDAPPAALALGTTWLKEVFA